MPSRSDRFISLLLRETVVDVSPEQFAFTSARSSVQIDTYIMIDDSTPERPMIAAVGESEGMVVDGYPNIAKVDLFSGDAHVPGRYGKSAYLSALLRHGLLEVYPWPRVLYQRVLCRTTAIFRGADTLAPFLCGYQRGLLRSAALEAGAGEVRFE